MGRILLFVLAVTLGLTACKKEENDPAEQLAIDKQIIEDYLAEKGLTAESTASGLYYIIDTEGTGINPDINSSVVINYTGKLTNENIFDSGIINNDITEKPIPLVNFIEGWQIGIPLFKVGSTGKLFVPSSLGYGTSGSKNGSIPPNTVLIFDVYLIGIR